VSEAPASRTSEVLRDLRAGLVVFLVALPLCLGIAAASGAPPIAGIVAGVVGGIFVGALSKSSLSVAGPAAGLTVIVAEGIEEVGWNAFLTAGIIAGLVQIALALLRLGNLAHFVPNAVIRGLLAAIGVILVLKQIPHAIGWDFDDEGDFAFFQRDGRNTFTEVLEALSHVHPGATLVAVLGAVLLFAWRDTPQVKLASIVPAPLLVVIVGVIAVLALDVTDLRIEGSHRVDLPNMLAASTLQQWQIPDPAAVLRPEVLRIGIVLGLVASLESLLSVEATDRLDPDHRLTPPDRELLAQGGGNVASAFLGGLPLTAVIVRSFANINAGGRTKVSAISHGVMLASFTVLAGPILALIPLSALAIILVAIGYKLTPIALYREMWAKGPNQFIPFIATVVAIVVTDLLTGTVLGIVIGLVFVLRTNFESAVQVVDDGPNRFVKFTGNVSFLNKGRLKDIFASAQPGGVVIVDGTRSRFIDDDIVETMREFEALAAARGTKLEYWRSATAAHPLFRPREDSP
jgi:MFS superfamily sulfate permease-like transporter